MRRCPTSATTIEPAVGCASIRGRGTPGSARSLGCAVRRSIWAIDATIDDTPLAGWSALAAQSALADSTNPERAVSAEHWKQRSELQVLHAPEPGATRWQIWHYDPKGLADQGLVDPLSLIVSLR